MPATLQRAALDLLFDEGAHAAVRSAVSIANRKFVTEVSVGAGGLSLDGAVRSSRGSGVHRPRVVVDETPGLAWACTCPESKAGAPCQHGMALALLNLQESQRDSLLARYLHGRKNPNELRARVQGVRSAVTEPTSGQLRLNAMEWGERARVAGWGRILGLSVRELSGPAFQLGFGLSASDRMELAECYDALEEFALHAESSALPGNLGARIHQWLVAATDRTNAVWHDSFDAVDVGPKTTVGDKFKAELLQRARSAASPVAQALLDAAHIDIADDLPTLRVAHVPAPVFEDVSRRTAVTFEVKDGHIERANVEYLDRAGTNELSVAIASLAVLHRIRTSREFTYDLNVFLARDPWEREKQSWRGLLLQSESPESTTEDGERVVVGFRINRKDSPASRSLDVVVPWSVEENFAEPLRWKLAKADWVRERLESVDSALTPEDRRILQAIAVRTRSRSADKRVGVAPVSGGILSLLVEHPHVMDEDGGPVLVRWARPRLVVRAAGSTHAQISLMVGEVDAGRVEYSDVQDYGREPSDVLVAWDGEKNTLLLTAYNHVFARMLSRRDGLLGRVSRSVLREVMQTLPWLSQHMDVEVDDDLRSVATPVEPEVVVRVRQELDTIRFEVAIRLEGARLPFRPGDGPDVVYAHRDGGVDIRRRTPSAERAAARELVEALGLARLREDPRWVFEAPSYDEAARVLEAMEEVKPRVEWVSGEPIRFSHARMAGSSLRVQKHKDWFELQGAVTVAGHDVDLHTLLEAIRQDRRTVLIAPGHIAVLDSRLREVFGLLAGTMLGAGTRGLKVTPLHAPLLADLEADGGLLTVSEEFQVSTHALKESFSLSPRLPRGLNATLRTYQRDGYAWLRRMACWSTGACLADDMGLGKTLQALAFLLSRSKSGGALVVTPTSLTFNWVAESERFTPGLSIAVWTPQSGLDPENWRRAGHVLVVSYDLLVAHLERFVPESWPTVVIDEAQAIKNATTLRARAVKELNADFRLALTGTPMENRTSELWSLFHFIAPGLLGSLSDFTAMWGRPIEREQDQRARESLASLIRPFVLRRLKSDVARELPEKIEKNVYVEQSAAELSMYQQLRESAVAELTGRVRRPDHARQAETRILVLAALTRMRQVACHGRLVSSEAPAISSKQAVLMEMLEELIAEGRRVLVFSQFPSLFPLLEADLKERGLSFGRLDGSTPSQKRQALVDEFGEGGFSVFLLSLKAGGTGLNLTAADTVIHLDPWWNPAVEDQATDRAHRIGQDRSVQVIRLITRGTVEEGILALHDEKRAMMDAMLAGTDRAGVLSTSELLALLGAPGDAMSG